MKDQLNEDKYLRDIKLEGMRAREHQRLLDEREQLRLRTQMDADKYTKKAKETMKQEWEFKFNQLTLEYENKIKHMQKQMKLEQERFIEEKE